MSPKIISIEGNIGAGKTTILQKIADRYANDPSVVFLREPVDIWETIKDAEGTTILANFYMEPEKYAFSFQVMAFVTRLTLLRNAVKENPDCKLIVCERSLEADRNIFAKMLFDEGSIDDMNYQITRKYIVRCMDSLIFYKKGLSMILDYMNKYGVFDEPIDNFLEKFIKGSESDFSYYWVWPSITLQGSQYGHYKSSIQNTEDSMQPQ
jgi:deoxyadenosine/deoxycytidine kinase